MIANINDVLAKNVPRITALFIIKVYFVISENSFYVLYEVIFSNKFK